MVRIFSILLVLSFAFIASEAKVIRSEQYYPQDIEDGPDYGVRTNSIWPGRTGRKEKLFLKDTDSEEKNTVLDLSKFALDTLDRIDPENKRRVLLDILDSKKQFVNGIMYHLTLLVGTVNDEHLLDVAGVPVKESDITDKSICKIQVLRSWAGTDISPMNAQVVESECVPEQKSPRFKRSEHHAKPGGIMPADVEGDNIQNIAKVALSKSDSAAGLSCARQVDKIHRATTQVVAGVAYDLTMDVCPDAACGGNSVCETCDVSVWEQPWLSSVEVTKFSCSPKQNSGTSSVKLHKERHRRSSKYGGSEEVDMYKSQEKIWDLALSAVKKLDEDIARPCDRQLSSILEAKKEVMFEEIYTLKLEVCEAPSCNDVNRRTNQPCEICVLKILHEPLLNFTDIPEATCVPKLAPTFDKIPKKKRGKSKGKEASDQFSEFMKKYNKQYTDEEKKLRFRIFRANLKKIDYLIRTEQGTGLYGITQYADLTTSEFRKYYLGFKPKKSPSDIKPAAIVEDIKIPDEFDWRTYNVVTPVKNQGMCGSCWAFSVTGNIEGQYALKHKTLLSFSEQELVDCDHSDDGCEGGYMNNAYDSIKKIGGLETERDYPYKGIDEKCEFKKNLTHAYVTGSVNITSNETQMAQWLYKNGPISIAINANAMQFYFGGVSHPLKFLCDPKDVDHGVLIVGYGVHRTKFTRKLLPYWLIKNSWGSFWGEKGYYRVFRGAGVCGVNTFPSSAIIE